MTARRQTAMDLVHEARQSIPVNVVALAHRLGVDVAYAKMPDHVSGYIHQANRHWVIVVNSLHHATRQRFTIAHELGHFLWHRRVLGQGTNDNRKYRADVKYHYYNNSIERKHEREANQFAAALLMPSEMVRHVHRNTGVNAPERIAALFGVSPKAMEIRLDELSERGEL